MKIFTLLTIFLLTSCIVKKKDSSTLSGKTADTIGEHAFKYEGKKILDKNGNGIDQNRATQLQIPAAEAGDMLLAIIGTSGRKPEFSEQGWSLVGHLSKSNASNNNKYGNCSLYAYFKKYDPLDKGKTIAFKGGNRRFFAVLAIKGAQEVVGFNFGKNYIDLRDSEVDEKGIFRYSAINGTKRWDGDKDWRGKKEWKGTPDKWIKDSRFLVLASMFDDEVEDKGASAGGVSMRKILNEQHGDDTMIIYGKNKKFKSMAALGDVTQNWQNADLKRIHQVFALNMLIGLR